jgi:hypothetical protein
MNERDLELREKSGLISTTDPLAVLLYVLIKDYLTAQQMEDMLAKVKETMPGTVVFNNGWLGKYALELKGQIDQLREDQAVGKVGLNTYPQSTGVNVDTKARNVVLEDADEVLSQLQKTLPPEEFERVQQEVKDYELEQAFEGLMKEEPE